MYYYYVRYSYFKAGKGKIGDGCMEAKMDEKISSLSHILFLHDKILQAVKEDCCPEAEYAMIDFYQLLRKDPN